MGRKERREEKRGKLKLNEMRGSSGNRSDMLERRERTVVTSERASLGDSVFLVVGKRRRRTIKCTTSRRKKEGSQQLERLQVVRWTAQLRKCLLGLASTVRN